MKARAELTEAREYEYLIINDDLEKTKDRLQAVIVAEHQRRACMAEVLEDLLNEKADFS